MIFKLRQWFLIVVLVDKLITLFHPFNFIGKVTHTVFECGLNCVWKDLNFYRSYLTLHLLVCILDLKFHAFPSFVLIVFNPLTQIVLLAKCIKFFKQRNYLLVIQLFHKYHTSRKIINSASSKKYFEQAFIWFFDVENNILMLSIFIQIFKHTHDVEVFEVHPQLVDWVPGSLFPQDNFFVVD